MEGGVKRYMTIGLKRGLLELVSYDPEWGIFFDNEKNRLRKSIGHIVLAIEHVGSTSIKNMCSKPIIDIAIGLEKYDDGFKCVEPLRRIGYLYLGERGIPGRHYFRRDSEIVKCHIHMFEISSTEWESHIMFRDYLRNHEEEAKEYALLKYDLKQKHGDDREKYTEAKTEFINKIIEKARHAKESD